MAFQKLSSSAPSGNYGDYAPESGNQKFSDCKVVDFPLTPGVHDKDDKGANYAMSKPTTSPYMDMDSKSNSPEVIG